MRTVGTHVPRPYGSLKEAQQRLVDLIGGLDAAASICGRSKTTLHRYCDPGSPNANMPLSIAVELERAVREYPVTRHLAALAGLVLVSLPPPEMHQAWLHHIARISKEFADVVEKTAECLRDDDEISPIEAHALLAEIDQNLVVLADMRVAVETRATMTRTSVA